MDIPLPKGLRGGERSPKQREVLRNCYSLPGDVMTIISRPVAKQVGNSLGPCRGSCQFKDELYMVSNDRLVKVTLTNPTLPPDSNLTVTDLGEIRGTALCQMSAGFTELFIMVEGGAAYLYNDVDLLREITDPSYRPSISLDYDGGRFILVPETGEPFEWTLAADPTNILAQNFADAEEFPDLNKAVMVRNRSAYICGSRSIDRLAYDSNMDTYRTVGGASSAVGYVGGKVNFSETFLFVGVGVSGGFGIYAMSEIASPVSTDAVNEILASYNASDLERCRASSFKWEGTEFALFYLPNHTLCFYGEWAIWHSGIEGSSDTWSVGFFQYCYGYIFSGDINTARIGIITDTDNEYNEPLDSGFTTIIRTLPRRNAFINRVYMIANTGTVSEEASVGMAVSRDGRVFGDMIYRRLGGLGDYTQEISWGSPVMKIGDFCALKFSWRGVMQFAVDGLSFE